MFTVAQITDLHITTDKDPLNQARNHSRLQQTFEAIWALEPRPVAIIATGDLVDRGQAEEYANLKAILAPLDIPIYLGVGNHDNRAALLANFQQPQVQCDPAGFVQYAIEFDQYRIVMCDTLDEGAEGGAFCNQRADWLDQTLRQRPRTPTLIGLHHPPISSGIRWMDEDPASKWILRLKSTLDSHEQVRAITSGHLHRSFSRLFGKTMVVVSPATSIQLTLNVSEIDTRVPDGREILREEPPGFVLHMFDDGEITAHTCLGGAWPSAVQYTHPFAR